ncbi:MAG: permease-like cell division protein FtsX [Armatimonadota bacterium]
MNLDAVGFLAGETWTSIKRHPLMSVASISNVTVCLSILGAFGLGLLNVGRTMGTLLEKGEVRVFLEPEADVEAVREAIFVLEEVEEPPIFVSKAEALEKMAALYGPKVKDIIDNPLPDSFRVRARRPQLTGQLAEKLALIEGVKDLDVGGEIMERLLALARALKWSGSVLAALLVFATFVVIQGTIRLTVHARRREIRIMQLVGATNSFIRVPFVLEGLYYGLVGGATACLLVLVSYFYVHDYVSQHLKFIPLAYGTGLYVQTGLGLLLAGALFGAGASLLAMRRYLQLI